MQQCRNPRPPGQTDGEVTCAEWRQEPTGHHHYCDGPRGHIGELHTCRCGHKFLTPESRDDDIGKCPLMWAGAAVAVSAAAVLVWSALAGWWT